MARARLGRDQGQCPGWGHCAPVGGHRCGNLVSRWGVAGGTAALGRGWRGPPRGAPPMGPGLPGPGPPRRWWCQALGGRAAGVGGPRLLSGIFRRGARRRFLCPSFRFPLARPPHSWSHREWGRGPGAGRPRLAPSGWDCAVGCGTRDGTPSPARPSSPLPAPAVGGSGSGVPGALLSAGLLCLGSFIYQLLRLGRGPHLPNRVSPLPWSPGCWSRSVTPQPTVAVQAEAVHCLASSFPGFGKDVPWDPV